MARLNGSKWIRPNTRRRIYLRDQYTCVWCGALHAKRCAPACLTLDHVVPRKHGGSNHASNLVTACRTCNTKRSTRNVLTFALELANNGLSDTGSAARILTRVILAMGRALPK